MAAKARMKVVRVLKNCMSAVGSSAVLESEKLNSGNECLIA